MLFTILVTTEVFPQKPHPPQIVLRRSRLDYEMGSEASKDAPGRSRHTEQDFSTTSLPGRVLSTCLLGLTGLPLDMSLESRNMVPGLTSHAPCLEHNEHVQYQHLEQALSATFDTE